MEQCAASMKEFKMQQKQKEQQQRDLLRQDESTKSKKVITQGMLVTLDAAFG